MGSEGGKLKVSAYIAFQFSGPETVYWKENVDSGVLTDISSYILNGVILFRKASTVCQVLILLLLKWDYLMGRIQLWYILMFVQLTVLNKITFIVNIIIVQKYMIVTYHDHLYLITI